MAFIGGLFHRKEKQDPSITAEPLTSQKKTNTEKMTGNLVAQASDNEAEPEVYEILEREILPAKIICPDCGGITLEGLEFCDKCGGELQ